MCGSSVYVWYAWAKSKHIQDAVVTDLQSILFLHWLAAFVWALWVEMTWRPRECSSLREKAEAKSGPNRNNTNSFFKHLHSIIQEYDASTETAGCEAEWGQLLLLVCQTGKSAKTMNEKSAFLLATLGLLHKNSDCSSEVCGAPQGNSFRPVLF